jgi:glycosyltransferase involved in cell wall biosynthesis
VTASEKLSLMRKAALILVTSLKEGWGLIVTEANSQGTPAIVYDVDGLRDSVKHGVTGIVSANNKPSAMGMSIVDILKDPDRYNSMREHAWKWSKRFTLENSYRDFLKIITHPSPSR